MTPALAAGWWFTSAWEQGPVYAVSWVVWVVFSIVLHELGHGWAAIRCGDRTPIETGHMTWNPVVHMGQMSLVMLAVAGVAWGAMPVNPVRFRRRHDDALVAFAGPSMNILLFLMTLAAHVVWVGVVGAFASHTVYTNGQVFLVIGGMLNIVLVALNLLPIPPLDGSRIVGSFVPRFSEWAGSDSGRVAGLLIFLPVFFFGGRVLFPAAIQVFVDASLALRSAVGL